MSVFEPYFALVMPVVDVRKMTTKKVLELCQLFDRLEDKAIKMRVLDTKAKLKDVQFIISEIDNAISDIIGLKKDV